MTFGITLPLLPMPLASLQFPGLLKAPNITEFNTWSSSGIYATDCQTKATPSPIPFLQVLLMGVGPCRTSRACRCMPQGFKPRAMRLHRAQAAGKVLDGLPGYSGVCVGFAHSLSLKLQAPMSAWSGRVQERLHEAETS